MGCPCANPPGTSRFKPISVPKPRKIIASALSENDEKNEQNEKISSLGINRKQYLESMRFSNVNKKLLENPSKYYKHTPRHLSGFIR